MLKQFFDDINDDDPEYDYEDYQDDIDSLRDEPDEDLIEEHEIKKRQRIAEESEF